MGVRKAIGPVQCRADLTMYRKRKRSQLLLRRARRLTKKRRKRNLPNPRKRRNPLLRKRRRMRKRKVRNNSFPTGLIGRPVSRSTVPPRSRVANLGCSSWGVKCFRACCRSILPRDCAEPGKCTGFIATTTEMRGLDVSLSPIYGSLRKLKNRPKPLTFDCPPFILLLNIFSDEEPKSAKKKTTTTTTEKKGAETPSATEKKSEKSSAKKVPITTINYPTGTTTLVGY